MKRGILIGALASWAVIFALPVLAHSEHDREVREVRDRADSGARERSRQDDGSRGDKRNNEPGGDHGGGSGKNDALEKQNSGDSKGGSGQASDQSAGSGGSSGGSGSDSGTGSSGGGEVSVSTSGGGIGGSDSSGSSGSNTSGSGSDGSGTSGSGSSGSFGSGSSGSGSSGSGTSGSGSSGSGSSGSGSSGSGSSGSGSSGSGGSGGSDDSGEADSAADGSVPAAIKVEVDREGRERRAAEVLLVGDERDVSAAIQQGYAILSRHGLKGSDGVIARLQVRSGETVDDAVARIRVLAPEANVSANFLFRPSGGAESMRVIDTPATSQRDRSGHIGMIDTGVDPHNSRLLGAITSMHSVLGAYIPRAHGTGVAQVAVAAGATISSVDVFEVDEHGTPVASVDAIARGLDWFIAQRESVVNVSIAGPNNPVLADMVSRAQRRGIVIVAAAGNEGPGAAPVFPAALDGVVAVTAIDQAGRVYRRANRGNYIDFAALGVRVEVLGEDGQIHPVSGTSFAAPRVAAAIAARVRSAPERDVGAVVRELASEAKDLGPRGRDATFGWGGFLN